MSHDPKSPTDAADHDDDPAFCDCSERVKPGEPYHCQVCDADWPAEEDEA
jgi:hypothetical protein